MDVVRAGSASIPVEELSFRFSRSSGPGGQNVNKRDTRVEVVFDLDDSPSLTATQKRLARARLGTRLEASGRLRVVSGAARTQTENRRLALERFAEMMSEALLPPPKPRRPTKPSAGAKERRVVAKKARGQIKVARRRPSADSD